MVPAILLVGAGGIGSPCALALAHQASRLAPGAPPWSLLVADDDLVDRSNLHRQILFGEADVGTPKLDALARAVTGVAPQLSVELHRGRLLPDVALELVSRAAVVVDATDNFASRFLASDAARLAGRPIVHAASVRWHATVLAASATGRPCYRCLFEDLPGAGAPDCATAGVVGPVCGVAGALAAALTLAILAGDSAIFGHVHTYDGRADRLRRVAFRPRAGCPSCGASPSIDSVDPDRYLAQSCDSP
ncbi:MAG: ThiF family adenylyltransferase [Polyangiaceae bacterium]